MIDIRDFIDWLWTCETEMAPRVQSRYDHYLTTLPTENLFDAGSRNGWTFDGRYHISPEKYGMALYHLKERDAALLAIYQTPASLLADLIAHSIRCSGCRNARESIAEVRRLTAIFEQEWPRSPCGDDQ